MNRNKRARLVLAATATLALMALGGPAQAHHLFKIVDEKYYFHGETTDQLNHVDRIQPATLGAPLGAPVPTFSQEAPAAERPTFQAAQSVLQLPGDPEKGNPYALYWFGEVDGPLDVQGELVLTVDIAASAYPAQTQALAAPLRVSVWADPDWASGTGGAALGEPVVFRVNASGGVHRYEVKVPVTGRIQETLLVQIRHNTPGSIWDNVGVVALYGSPDRPSGFTLPVKIPIDHD